VIFVKAAGYGDYLGARDRKLPEQVRKPNIVADRQAEATDGEVGDDGGGRRR